MKKYVVTIFLLISWLSNVAAQESIPGKGDFKIDFDASRFFGDTNHVFVELYYGIHENALSYAQESGRYSGVAYMKYVIYNGSGVVAQKEWTVPHMLDDSVHLNKNQILTGIESAVLVPGTYAMTFIAYDVREPARRDSFSMPLTINLFEKNKETLSDLELCTVIQSSSDMQSVFYKNTLEVVPNAGRLYGIGLPILYYYVEVYNLSKNQSQNPLTIHSSIVDAAGKEIVTRDKLKPRLHDASVEIGTMNLSAVRGGTYMFRVNLTDSVRGVIASTSKKCFIYKPGTTPDSLPEFAGGFAASEYAFMSQADIDREFAFVKYLLKDIEIKQYEALTDLKAKQQFIFEFWDRHDVDPVTGEHGFKKEYFRRIESANRDYATQTREGWKTERGRVLVMYGPYDDIERFSSSSESNPYEIWHYNSLQGGVIFVFVDRNASGDFMLVHSTHRDENHDENWYNTYALKVR